MIMKRTFKQKFIHTLILMLLPIILYFMEGSLSVYVANAQDFGFHYQDFFFVHLIIGVLAGIVVALIGALLPDKISRVLGTLILYVGIMSYIQDMFLNIKLSEVDGSNMNWEELRGYTIVNTVVWVVVLILFIIFYVIGQKKISKNYDKITVGAAAFVSAVQLVTVATLLISAISVASDDAEKPRYGLSGNEQYQLSSENNVIVFVLDSFGSSQLEYGLRENPGLLDGFEDFTYYDNADSSYLYTYPSMTYMLTGVPLSYDKPGLEYLNTAWSSDETSAYYDGLHQAGYDVRLYSTGGTPVYGDMMNLANHVDNAVPVTLHIDKKAVLIRMLKISIYKYVPYIIKPRFEVPTYMFQSLISYEGISNINCGNSVYYEGLMANGLSVESTGKTNNSIIIQHLDGMHLPTELAADGSYKPDSSLLETEEGLFLILGNYMNQLKELGLYDNATIIITADHGRWDVFTQADDPQVIYFVKRAGESHSEMQISHAPISHSDFRATLYDIVGVRNSIGTSIFDWSEDALRERVLIHPETDDNYPPVAGEVCNVYAEYRYTGNRNDLTNHIMEDGPDAVYERPVWR